MSDIQTFLYKGDPNEKHNQNSNDQGEVKTIIQFMKSVDEGLIDEIVSMLENCSITHKVINAALSRAITSYKTSHTSLEIIDLLLK